MWVVTARLVVNNCEPLTASVLPPVNVPGATFVTVAGPTLAPGVNMFPIVTTLPLIVPGSWPTFAASVVVVPAVTFVTARVRPLAPTLTTRSRPASLL